MIASEYWQKQFETLEAMAYSDAKGLYTELEKLYERASKELTNEISLWYLLLNDEISYAETRKYLDNKELKNFKSDISDYLTQEYISEKWQDVLEKLKKRQRVTLQESLIVRLQQHIEALFGKQEELYLDGLKRLYENQFYHSVYEIERGFGVGSYFGGLDENKLSTLINTSWASDDKSFLERLTAHKTSLINTLLQEMTTAIIHGDDYREATQRVLKRMNVSLHAAGRLVMTESAYLASRSTIDSFKALGVDKYEFIATLDKRTSLTCREMDRAVFKVSEYKAGRTAPPMHCYCRSHIMPYFEGSEDIGRVARGNDDKQYIVPANMSYAAWEKVYVKKTISLSEWKKSLQKYQNDGIINIDFKFDLQLFAVKYEDYSIKALRTSIKKNKKQLVLHRYKITNIDDFIAEDNPQQNNPYYREGLKRHWQKEIINFENQIIAAEKELERRRKV